MAFESESNNAKRIEDTENHSGVAVFSFWIVRNAVQPALRDRDEPHNGTIANGSDGTNQRDTCNGVQIGELRQKHGGAGKDQIPLDGGEWLGGAFVATHDFEEELHAGAANDNQGDTGAARKVIDGEDSEDLGHFVTEGSAEELKISAVTHPSFSGFMKHYQKP